MKAIRLDELQCMPAFEILCMQTSVVLRTAVSYCWASWVGRGLLLVLLQLRVTAKHSIESPLTRQCHDGTYADSQISTCFSCLAI
jgi:hypothetical protein